jgi:DHA1 family solute carrier family 18 vesicular amine transporter 1/2
VRPVVLAATGTLVAAGGLVVVAHAASVWLVAAAIAGVALGASLVLTPTLAVMADVAESREPPAYGAVYALYTLAYAAGLTAAPLLAGLATENSDFTAATSAAAVALAVAAAALMTTRAHRLGHTPHVANDVADRL